MIWVIQHRHPSPNIISFRARRGLEGNGLACLRLKLDGGKAISSPIIRIRGHITRENSPCGRHCAGQKTQHIPLDQCSHSKYNQPDYYCEASSGTRTHPICFGPYNSSAIEHFASRLFFLYKSGNNKAEQTSMYQNPIPGDDQLVVWNVAISHLLCAILFTIYLITCFTSYQSRQVKMKYRL
jgi:hypothetical protein